MVPADLNQSNKRTPSGGVTFGLLGYDGYIAEVKNLRIIDTPNSVLIEPYPVDMNSNPAIWPTYTLSSEDFLANVTFVSVPSTTTSRNLSDFFSTLASSVLLFSVHVNLTISIT